jgi:hypothetical protein
MQGELICRRKFDAQRRKFLRSKNGMEGRMRKIVLLAVMGLTLAGCQTAREDRILGGSLIGGGTGALIGGLAGGSAGAAVAGGLVGAAAGAIIADATRPGRCYYYTRSGHRRYVRCR